MILLPETGMTSDTSEVGEEGSDVASIVGGRSKTLSFPAAKSMNTAVVYHVSRSRGIAGPIGSEIVKYLQAKGASPDTNVLVFTVDGWGSLYDYDLERPIAQFGPQVFLGGVPFTEDDDRLPAWESLIAYLRPRASNPVVLEMLEQTQVLLLQLEEEVVGEVIVEETLMAERDLRLRDDFPVAYAAAPLRGAPVLPAMPASAPVNKSAYEMGHRRGRNVSSPGVRRVRPTLTPLATERVVVRETFTDPL